MGSGRARQVVVEICRANDLMPKDGEGSASAFVEVDFDNQRKQTKTKARDLNPVWNEKFVFNVTDASALEDEVIEINLYNDKKTTRGSFLGRVKIPCSSLPKEGEDAIVGYALDKRSLFSNVRGEIYIKAYYTEDSAGPNQGGKKSKGGDGGEAKPAEEKQNKVTFDPSLDDIFEPKPQVQIKYAAQQQTDSKKVQLHQAQGGNYSAVMSAHSRHAPADFNLKETNPKLAATAKRRMSMLHAERTSTYDLVERMEYLYVKVVKARNLAAKDITGSSDPYVLVKVGNLSAKTRVIDKSLNPEWNQVFAFGKDKFQAPLVELTIKDKDTLKDDFIGFFAFEIAEVPTRVPPDSPLAPQWYRLEGKKGAQNVNLGEIMVSVWKGTQADEAFPEAWQSDSGGHPAAKSKVYLSPRLWYLRVNVIEAQDLLLPGDKSRLPDIRVKAQLGFQTAITRASGNRSNNPFWNEDVMFVAAEPFEEQLLLTVEDRVSGNKDQVVGKVQIAVGSIERRVDARQVSSRWYNLDRPGAQQEKPAEGQPNPNQPPKPKDTGKFMSRLHLRVCLDGGYHVLDESTHYSSDMRPSAKQIWKPPIGVLELGILSASGLLPMKTRDQRGTTDAYVVAKYGQKWVRSRTIVDSFAPRWNEQYTWEVYDPCTVLTVGVFDNSHLQGNGGGGGAGGGARDGRLGKVRIRLSTLEGGRVYAHSYPLLLLHPSGVKKMGELELAVRFSPSSSVNVLACYARPLLPKMHYLYPLGVAQLEALRGYAMRIVAMRLMRAEPPLRGEAVQYMLDVDSNLWSMRKSKANWFRILGVLSGMIAVGRWFSDICRWKNPITTVLVHFLFLILIWYPELIFPTLFLYMFLIGAWHYKFRPRLPPHMDPRLSHAEAAEPDELDEEFDNIPTSKPQEVVRARYDRLRAVSGRIQTVLGDMATQGERFQALLSWRDPRATAMFILFCLLAAIILYVTPFRVVAVVYGFYVLRHPRFRDRLPGVPMNFFRRLPALSDRML
ncbi:hypothetical protein KP509_02G003400 [Ceratopteris richardii]|uniref:C2 domain-containing protein n=1 Tax=Ceratopteris richardii TaxID=49495 RepID=A0A8T2V6H3_CERRI|nr:hypothetical protein KP509_02G003400 [Ceratopteris richardii]KAH7442810.1 hypothetical protein KP509_02G003400 [Ceratopteris richardii]